ncbi:hypothetical protein, partial [Rhizobium chutanense]|uniref:hypothetical protein n=1 Tax=Rhizobium chutanense TaxID=2035448 RepID=UPI001AECB709
AAIAKPPQAQIIHRSILLLAARESELRSIGNFKCVNAIAQRGEGGGSRMRGPHGIRYPNLYNSLPK